MATIKQINEALEKAGITAEPVKGKGYFYFVELTNYTADEAADYWVNGTAVYVYRLNEFTTEEWVKEASRLKYGN